MPSTLPRTEAVNADFVTSQLLVGGDLAPDDALATAQVAELHALGVGDIVDARDEWSDERFVAELAPSIRYHHVGIDDAGQTIPDAWFDRTVALVQHALAGGGRVLVHCHMGINRGPSLALAVLLAEGCDVVDAMAAIRTARPIAAMAYAENVLAWHHRRSGASAEQRQHDRRRVARWREQHPLDVVRIIRTQREHERQAWLDVQQTRFAAS